MEPKDIKLGSVGDLKIELTSGKAKLTITAGASALGGSAKVKADVSAEVDSSVLLDLLFAEIEAKSPAGVKALEELVKMGIKAAVAAI